MNYYSTNNNEFYFTYNIKEILIPLTSQSITYYKNYDLIIYKGFETEEEYKEAQKRIIYDYNYYFMEK